MFFTHTTYDVIRNALRKQTVDGKISKEITPETTRNPRLWTAFSFVEHNKSWKLQEAIETAIGITALPNTSISSLRTENERSSSTIKPPPKSSQLEAQNTPASPSHLPSSSSSPLSPSYLSSSSSPSSPSPSASSSSRSSSPSSSISFSSSPSRSFSSSSFSFNESPASSHTEP